MVIWLAILFALAFCPLTLAIAFPAPLPTDTQPITSEPPHPTPGFQLKRRDESDSYSLLTAIRTGGWYETEISYSSWAYTCSTGYSCVFHQSNTAFAGMQGCCSKHNCNFATTCYDGASISSDKSLTNTDDPWAAFCTNIDYAECGTLRWDSTYVHMGCFASGFESEIYTEATWYNGRNSAWSVEIDITTIDDDFLSSISSTKMEKLSARLGPSSSSTESVSTATTPPEPTPPSPDESNTPKSSGAGAGAIAGGVVGGVVGGAAITAAAIFLFLRRKKKSKQGPSDEPNETDYQAIPQNQSHHSSWLMQPVTEPQAAYKPESSEPKPYPQGPPAELPDTAHR